MIRKPFHHRVTEKNKIGKIIAGMGLRRFLVFSVSRWLCGKEFTNPDYSVTTAFTRFRGRSTSYPFFVAT